MVILVHVGKDNKNSDSPLITADTNKTTAAFVLKLTESLLKQVHTVWMDNFYNLSSLAKTLNAVNKTDCWHTAVESRKYLQKKGDTKLKRAKQQCSIGPGTSSRTL